MQPQLRQMPPRYSRSTIAVLNPSCEARMAVTYPPGPDPMMMMSKLVSAMRGFRYSLCPIGPYGARALGSSILGNAVAEGPVFLRDFDQVDEDILRPQPGTFP